MPIHWHASGKAIYIVVRVIILVNSNNSSEHMWHSTVATLRKCKGFGVSWGYLFLAVVHRDYYVSVF